ncbi:LytR/AlgR family response regulator transcription factor [Litoribacter populi]|uniref:LytR/AlgR family response regulator transcription factor n=1 Tax=Litoribacter populi TaxID=2598460 RepID=UPI0011810F97|nr:LytTR family DNA-binding domain-containing protein [Litoribacter populi]
MNLIKSLIIDDEPYAQEVIEEYIKKVPFLHLLKKSNDAIDGLKDIEELKPDLVFMDIQMPEMTGIELIKILQGHKPAIIITTAYSEHALEGYELEISDYLLKPIRFDRFLKAVNKIKKQLTPYEPKASQYFWVKENGKLVHVPMEDVLMAKSMKDYIQLYLKKRKIITYQTMKRMKEILPAEEFMRVSRSCIIRKSAIKSINGNILETTVGEEIIIGGTYKEAIKSEINEWLR